MVFLLLDEGWASSANTMASEWGDEARLLFSHGELGFEASQDGHHIM